MTEISKDEKYLFLSDGNVGIRIIEINPLEEAK